MIDLDLTSNPLTPAHHLPDLQSRPTPPPDPTQHPVSTRHISLLPHLRTTARLLRQRLSPTYLPRSGLRSAHCTLGPCHSTPLVPCPQASRGNPLLSTPQGCVTSMPDPSLLLAQGSRDSSPAPEQTGGSEVQTHSRQMCTTVAFRPPAKVRTGF